jgi:hypothetical protein
MKVVHKKEVEDAVVVDEQLVNAETTNVEESKVSPLDGFRTFDFGNLTLECGRCGNQEILELGVEGGIQVILPTTDKHKLDLVCPKCKNFIKLYFTENFTKKKEVKDETKTADKEKESESGVSEDTK